MNKQILMQMTLVALAGGAVAYLLLYPLMSGEKRAIKRQMAFKGRSERQKTVRSGEAVNRRKQLEESLKDIAKRNDKKTSRSLNVLITQAGLTWSKKTFFIISGIMAVGVSISIYALTNQILYALPGLIIGGLGVPRWLLMFLAKRRIKKIVEELPNALDVITRGIKAGLPLGDCLRIIVAEGSEPIKTEFLRAIEAQLLGLTIAEAIELMAESVPIAEVKFFSIVITVQAKAGGNLSEALGNLSNVLRERKKMANKVQALSMEAKASAIIIGAMPLIVGALVYVMNPDYISKLWTTDMGKMALAASGFWMAIGIFTMKKMINFDI
jgi:tight adherence protein B